MYDMQVFGVERLEDRLLLAVNVTQNGGNLVIEGDASDDTIAIVGLDDGDVRVIADTDGDGGFEYLDYSGVRNVHISGGDGDDAVVAFGADIEGDLTIDGGDGDDVLTLRAGFIDLHEVGGNVLLEGGDGYDRVHVSGFDIDGKLTIDTGDGSSTVTLSNQLHVAGKTTINTGAGDDADHVSIDAYYGDVELGALVINTGGGDDLVEFDASGTSKVTVHGRTDIDMGGANDVLDFYADYGNLIFAGNFSADGGAGDDYFFGVADAMFEGKFKEKNFEYVS
jgi:hypothetical protein